MRLTTARWITAPTAIAFAVGCAGESTFALNDATFKAARERHTRAAAEVAASGAPADEAALFMQAESFYRYRFDPPARGFGTYVWNALAVASDFAPFQALAASAGAFELRLRTYDGAVLLWETLLREHPQTTLRPLTLYRLGWAYRNVSTNGFPREDGDLAFAELVQRHPDSPLSPLAREALNVPTLSQRRAIALSGIPGAGQMYAGETSNGLVRLGIGIALAAVAFVPLVVLYRKHDQDDLRWGRDWPWLATSLGGVIALNVSYVAAYQDAQRAAVQFNERAEAAFTAQHPDAP